jgi:hypothetical protein
VESPQADAAGDWSATVPRRHEKAGNRPPGPRSLDALLAELRLLSDRSRSVLATDNARADADEAREAASTKYRDRSNGSAPVNDRRIESRPQSRTARIHLPDPELDTEAEQREANRAWVRESVSCPRCGVGVGERCRGRRGERASNHFDRLALAWVPRG